LGSDDRLAVHDINTGIQLLGRYAGTPVVFLTLQGCDVRCSWCNVPETWALTTDPRPKPKWSAEFKRPVTKWLMLTREEIFDACAKFRQRHVVITGGEPLLHNLRPVVQGFRFKGYTVQIETSGTKNVDDLDPSVWLSVSPKPNAMDAAISRANEIIYPLTNMDSLQHLQKEIAPKIKPNIPIYLHPIGSQRLVSQATAAAFKFNYCVADFKVAL
jgi:7-carboxy-7-deazaguanine synthase